MLYASAILAEWHKIPQTVFLHQIVPVTIRYLNSDAENNVSFTFINEQNVSLRAMQESLIQDELYHYKTLYFKILGMHAKLPDIILTTQNYTTTLQGLPLQVNNLNYPRDFCNVLAKNLYIIQHKSVQFNQHVNLVVMKLEGNLSNLEDFAIPYAQKGEIKEINESFPVAQIIYYAFIPAAINELKMSYFNTDKREFQKLSFPIKVKDEIVSTQSDINPAEDKNKTLKITIFVTLGAVLLLLAFWLRSIFNALLALLAFFYAGYLSMPMQRVCLKENSKIYILPTKNSTIFRINHHRQKYVKLNEVSGYVKIELENNKVGWVKHEDLCQN
ncbi:hypothetical protein SAMN05660197_1567 [Nitratiruptor tergarcus DSM 16512]|uniref:SH3 domain-containing protein n=1 Tax=Nitratiruptor tergarcus DSM 16512 TaxID=1069081 RepID=A0A1W1WU70_9BACT|nr:hypothetical protein SAMN05660197_1567 [Nitratiruptor tergarcus DSM 16512]